MFKETQLDTYCYQLEKIGYEIGIRTINEEQRKELKKAYENGLNKGVTSYEESSKIVNDIDLDDFLHKFLTFQLQVE